jgi:hypothetical protein
LGFSRDYWGHTGIPVAHEIIFVHEIDASKVPALARESIESVLRTIGVSAQDIRALLRCNDWCALESIPELFDRLSAHLIVGGRIVFGETFERFPQMCSAMCSGLAFLTSKKSGQTPKINRSLPIGRALDEDQSTVAVAFIRNGYSTHSSVTERDLLRFIEINYRKYLTSSWVNSFLKTHGHLICQSIVRPQENVRLEVPHEYLDQSIKLIKECGRLVPSELLFNIKESGFSDWEARRPTPILIPVEAKLMTLHYPTSRKIHHQTPVCCVTAAGDAYCPLLIFLYFRYISGS